MDLLDTCQTESCQIRLTIVSVLTALILIFFSSSFSFISTRKHAHTLTLTLTCPRDHFLVSTKNLTVSIDVDVFTTRPNLDWFSLLVLFYLLSLISFSPLYLYILDADLGLVLPSFLGVFFFFFFFSRLIVAFFMIPPCCVVCNLARVAKKWWSGGERWRGLERVGRAEKTGANLRGWARCWLMGEMLRSGGSCEPVCKHSMCECGKMAKLGLQSWSFTNSTMLKN